MMRLSAWLMIYTLFYSPDASGQRFIRSAQEMRCRDYREMSQRRWAFLANLLTHFLRYPRRHSW